MKKSNWIILGILVIAAIFFLWLWYHLSFNLVDNPLDLVLTIIWWAVVIIGCIAIHQAEKKRQERIRTVFLTRAKMYNSEAGLTDIESGTSQIEAIEQMLAQLKYDFHMEEPPDESDVHFDCVVRNKTFEFDEDDNAQDAEGEDKTEIKVKKWEGEVAFVDLPNQDPRPFSSREELEGILTGAAA